MTVTKPAVEDRYPTRVSGETHLLERSDPTVWSDAPGPMDAAELGAYDAKGYLATEGLLSPAEVQAYWAELHRLCADQRLAGDPRVECEADTGDIRTIYAAHQVSSLVGELVRDPRILDRARQVLGSEVTLHQSRVHLLPGFSNRGFFWRSDFEQYHAEDGMVAPRALSMSIALADNYAVGGGLMMMPGSHRVFVPCALGKGPSRQDITRLVAEHGIDQFTGQAGAALLSDCNVMHGAGNNITPYPRSNIFLVFNSVENPLTAPFAGTAVRKAHYADRDGTPVGR